MENIKRASGILIDRLDQELGLERGPEEISRENLTKETGQIVADAGIKAENVVIVAEQPGRMGRMVYVTNTDERDCGHAPAEPDRCCGFEGVI